MLARENIDKYLGQFDKKPVSSHLSTRPVKLNVPIYLVHSYEYIAGKVFGQDVLFALAKASSDFGVRQLERQYEILGAEAKRPIIFVFESLKPHMKQGLINRQIPFIIPNRAIFIPNQVISVEQPAAPVAGEEKQALSSWAEVILTRQLLKGDVEGKTGHELSEMFSTSKMTVSRSLRELERSRLAELNQKAQSKSLNFEARDSLWRKAKHKLRSPVKSIVFVSAVPPSSISRKSGISALSEMTMLADDRLPTFAVSEHNFREMLRTEKLKKAFEEDSAAKIEVWGRDPKILSADGCIDPISLYLILKDESDERVQHELETLMKKVNLKGWEE